MDVIKMQQIYSRPVEKVVVHPLVLLSIVDHYNRVARDTRKRVIGVLLGSFFRGVVNVTNSYAVPFDEDEKDPSIWFLDHNYHESMFGMFKRINAKEHVVGWYSTGPKLRGNDLDVHGLFYDYVPNPVLLIIDVQPKELGIPTKAYCAAEENTTGKSQVFVHLPSEIASDEVEDIDVGSHKNEGLKIFKFNVGGRLFETSHLTIDASGTDSLLSSLSSVAGRPIFIDRDPEIFSSLLSLLRSGRLPTSSSNRFTTRELLEDASFYGIDHVVRSVLSPKPLNAIDATIATVIYPKARSPPSTFAVSANEDCSVLIASAGQISVYDGLLSPVETFRTHVDWITALCWVQPKLVAIGSTDAPGLHFYDVAAASHVGSVYWIDPTDLRVEKARVTAVASSPTGEIFAGLHSPHNENSVLVIDRVTLQPMMELGRQTGSSARTMAVNKLRFLPGTNLLMGSSVNSGTFGYCGYIRIWDIRVRSVVWETTEPGSGRSSRVGDPLADVDADDEVPAICKVCSRSGDVAFADLRKLGLGDPWVYLEEKNPSLKNCGTGENSSICCYKKQIFVGRDGGRLEVWSRPAERIGSFRRNFVDNASCPRGSIKKMEAGRNRLFVCREGLEGVEVWESRDRSGCTKLLS